MYDYVYIIYDFVKFLDEPLLIMCWSCHPGGLAIVLCRAAAAESGELSFNGRREED